MKRHQYQTVQQPPSQGQTGDLHCALIGAMPKTTTLVAQHIIGKKGKIAEVLKPLFEEVSQIVKVQHDWAMFYQQTLGIVLGDDIYNVEFPRGYVTSEHLLIHHGVEFEHLCELLKILQESKHSRIEVFGMSETDLPKVDNFYSTNASGGRVRMFKANYLLKVSDAPMVWTEPALDVCFMSSIRTREHFFNLMEMMLYELRYGNCYDNYGPVACYNSRPKGDEDSIMAFEKRAGLIRIFPVRRDSSIKLVWPALSAPVEIPEPMSYSLGQ